MPKPLRPSSLYGATLWRLGLGVARHLPPPVARAFGATLARAYARVQPRRFAVVADNLAPAVQGDRLAAGRAARRLFANFGRKVADLWRYEAGLPVDDLLAGESGWEHFAKARATGRGILLVTVHLGNWEFGAPWLRRRGVPLHVLTLAEPDPRLTALRARARAQHGISTLVIGSDPFSFVELIRLLDGGGVAALLIDRPPPTASRVEVELFARPFLASNAAAELARAAHCVILPVYLPYAGTGYAAHILPAIEYDRRALGDRNRRVELTGEILRAFQSVIQQYLDQWYHFVPIWPQSHSSSVPAREPDTVPVTMRR